MRVLGLIPARGGSKGIPRKNLVDVAGRPLVVHSVDHALHSQRIDRVVVSTDDPEIRDVAVAAGAEVPFLRPADLARDDTLDLPVFEHALQVLRELDGYVPDLIVHLRPTAPLRRIEWIDDSVDMLAACPEADSVRSVSPPDKHPYRMFRIGQDGYLDPIMSHEHPMPYLLRRQDLPPVYYYNCVIDVTRPTTILGMGSMTGRKILPFKMAADDAFDIDSPRDLEIVRMFARSFG